MELQLPYRMVLLLLSLVYIVKPVEGQCPNLTAPTVSDICKFCREDPEFRYKIACNAVTSKGASMTDITSHIKMETAAENITELAFIGFENDTLPSNIFSGFTALDTIEITSSKLSYIQPSTFSSLPNLHFLLLHKNKHLKWLSGDSFEGLDSLKQLELDDSGIEHLREDMQPFFSRITEEISLAELPLQCDCHLLWLFNFINDSSITVVTHDVDCFQNSDTDFSECFDACQLGYHPCNTDATCTIVNNTNPVCSCGPCYEGDGVECNPEECPFISMECDESTGDCVCGEDYSTSTNDGDPCIREVSEVFSNLTRDCSSIAPDDTNALSECSERLSHAAAHHLDMPAEISRVVSLLEEIVKTLAQENAQSPSLNISQNLVETASELLSEGNLQLWQNTTSDATRDAVAIFSAMNELGTLLLTYTNITNITTDNIAMVLVRPNCESKESVPDFEGYDISSDLLGQAPPTGSESTLSLPSSLFSDVFANGSVSDCSQVGVVSLVYGGIGPPLTLNEDLLLSTIGCSDTTKNDEEICPWYGEPSVECPTDWRLNSVVISATVINSTEAVSTQLSSPVTISLSHQDLSLSSPICAFIDESQPLRSNDSWLTENCERDVQASTETMTVCKCYHLTSFALVMSPSDSPPENRPLSIATKAGLSLSILCLLATIVLLFSLKLVNKTLHQVHRQLAVALGLAQLVFLVGVDRSAVPSPDQLCTTWAALLHYLLLATFLWQLCEGFHLLLLVGKVFGDFDKVQYAYFIFAWGLPLLIVGPTLGVRFCDYGSTSYCWITPDGGARWAFHGPVIGVLLINVVVLVYVVSVIVRLANRKEESTCLFITLIHASLVLVPILGVTWVLGFLVLGTGVYATVIEWLFFAFTTLQGVAIFITHCVLNKDVRTAFLKTMGCRKVAEKQETLVNFSRRFSKAGPSQTLLISKHSGSQIVGGFVTSSSSSAAPSRRESDVEAPYQHCLSAIREENSSQDNLTNTPKEEETSCHDSKTTPTLPND